MKELFTSASKIVFIVLAGSACAGFIMKILPVDQFMLLATGAFAFYFSNKGDTTKDFAGK